MRVVCVLLLILSGCSTAPPTPDSSALPGLSPAQTWITVGTPSNGILPQDMSIELGGLAWSVTADGGGGVIANTISEVTSVRLIGVRDCHTYAAFEVEPGSNYEIRFGDDGSVTVGVLPAGVEQVVGPGLVERVGGPVCQR
jgi:hypothetical protein